MLQRLALLLAASAVSAGVVTTETSGVCNHNNCLRAVIASAFWTRSGVADCGSFMAVTVTPATVTVYATATVQTESVVPTTDTQTSTTLRTTTVSTETQMTTELHTQGQTKMETVATTTSTSILFFRRQGGADAGGPVTTGGTTWPAYASACTAYSRYSSACSCVGVTAKTVTADAPSTTITLTATSTSLTRTTTVASETVTETADVSVTDTTLSTIPATLTTTDATSSVTAVETVQATNLFRNGNFETGAGGWGAWKQTLPKPGDRVKRKAGSVVAGAGKGGYAAVATGMVNNDLWQFSQDINPVRDVRYTCSYDWLFTNYYETVYPNGKTYVPYIHGYLSSNYAGSYLWTIDIPDGRPQMVGVWQTTTFTFTSLGGKYNWEFDCASPQARKGPGGGNNTLYIDNMSCIPM